MIPIPPGVRVWLATGYTDMRRGFFEQLIFIWDIAAAAVILRESGGDAWFQFERERPTDGFTFAGASSTLLPGLFEALPAAPPKPAREK